MELYVLSYIDLFHHFNGNVSIILTCSFSFLFIDIFESDYQIGGCPEAPKKILWSACLQAREFKKK